MITKRDKRRARNGQFLLPFYIGGGWLFLRSDVFCETILIVEPL